MELILVILLIYLIFRDVIRDDITKLWNKKPEKDEIEEERQKLYKKEFDDMMSYSVEDAIRSKRSEIDG